MQAFPIYFVMKKYLSLVKFAHTVFAMPFALLGYFLAVQLPGMAFSARLLVLVVLCMVFARNAAMAFNRYLDRHIDKANPRTASREIPAGIISPESALLFVFLNAVAFIITTWFLNPLCFYLSPVALLVILGYSFTKRYSALCHLVLGMGLALAPVGAYIAVTGEFSSLPVLYGFAVLFWVSGFDIIYAMQDDEFDRSMQLHSIPSALGREKALKLSELLHVFCALCIIVATWVAQLNYPQINWLSWMAAIFFIGSLVYQHLLVKPNDLSRVNLAFFTTNGVASLAFGGLTIADLLV